MQLSDRSSWRLTSMQCSWLTLTKEKSNWTPGGSTERLYLELFHDGVPGVHWSEGGLIQSASPTQLSAAQDKQQWWKTLKIKEKEKYKTTVQTSRGRDCGVETTMTWWIRSRLYRGAFLSLPCSNKFHQNLGTNGGRLAAVQSFLPPSAPVTARLRSLLFTPHQEIKW